MIHDLKELQVYGITANQVHAGAYALILEEVNGTHRIPVVIGTAEAQSIASYIEGSKPQRPLTHDLFKSFTLAFGIRISKVIIYKFAEGVFYSEIYCNDGEREITIDARTSDAVALALRTGAKIYTTQDVIDKTGFIVDGDDLKSMHRKNQEPEHNEISLSRYTIAELSRMMEKAAEKEDYERAAEIRNIIATKQSDNALPKKDSL